MAIKKLVLRHSFPENSKLNIVFQDYKVKVNEIIDSQLESEGGTLALYDTDQTNTLSLKWNEDDSNDRILNLEVNKADRTIDLTGNLTVESASIIGGDFSIDGTPTLGGLTIINAITEFSTDVTLGDDSDSAVPTEKAVKAYVDGQSHVDEKVKIDTGATAGYIGAASNDGILRVGSNLSYADGGNFITLDVDSTKVTNWDAAYTHVSNDGTDHSYIDQDLQVAASPTHADLTLNGVLNVNADGTTGEYGINFYSINSTYSTIAQSDAEGIATSSDLRIGLDESLRALYIMDRGDIAVDYVSTAYTHPTLVFVNADGDGRASISMANDTFTFQNITGNGFYFETDRYMDFLFTGGGGDITADSIVWFGTNGDGTAELVGSSGNQDWFQIEPWVNQTSTAGYRAFVVDVTESGTGSGTKELLTLQVGSADKFTVSNAGLVTLADGGSINLQEDITFTGATTENLIKMPDNLLDALSIQEGSNKYITFDTVNDEEDIKFYKSVDIFHTATHADDHGLEVDADAAGYGDIKAMEVDYITGNISAGKDEGVILLNIDETAATGGDVFGLEVLATEGSAGIYGMKVGVVIGPIHQDSGTFVNPTTGTDNTTSSDVAAMIDGNVNTTTAIFESNSEYILIGGAAVFEEIEFIITTFASGAGIKPTFWYSTAGSHQFTQFTPVDGTDGFKHTGVVAWDASDLSSHAVNTDTNTYDIKIIRTRNNLSTSPILGYAKTASTTEYIWDKDGNVNIKSLAMSAIVNAATDTDKFLVLDGSGNVDFRTGANVLADISAEPADGTIVKDADFGSAGLCATNGSGTYSIVTDNSATWDGLISCTFANVDTALAAANSAVDFNSQNLTGVGSVAASSLTLTTDLAVTEGGTGISALTDHGVLLGSGTSAVTITDSGADGEVLVSNGASTDPDWEYIPKQNLITNSGFGVSTLSVLTDIVSAITVTDISSGVCTTSDTQSLQVGDLVKFNGGGTTVTSVYEVTAVTADTDFTLHDTSITDGTTVNCDEATPAFIAADTKAPDTWIKTNTLDLYRWFNHPTYHKGMYGLQVTKGVDGSEYLNAFGSIASKDQHYLAYRGRTVTFGCWLYSVTAADNVKLQINDSDGTTESSFVVADTLTWVEITRDCGATITSFTPRILFDGDTADVAYVSQPMLVYGSSIGEGNYQPIQGEWIWGEVGVSTSIIGTYSTTAWAILNLEADSDGKIPKGLKAYYAFADAKDSGSASTTDCYFSVRPRSGLGMQVVSPEGLFADAEARAALEMNCNADGDVEWIIAATGVNTFDLGKFRLFAFQVT